MSMTTADQAGGLPDQPAYPSSSIGPLEQGHRLHANYRAVADGTRITRTDWRIATANGLGGGSTAWTA